MEEKKLFIEIPGGRNDFHSAILTSYTFDFHHFEYQVLKSLRQKFITNVAVFVDYRMLDEVIGFTTSNLKHLSQSYSVNGIISKGAFHPKINFLVGDNKLLMFLGSGNITPGGHGKNHELFTGFYADSKENSQLPILLEAWTYLQTLVKDIPGYNLERISKIISTNADLLKTNLIGKHSFYKLDDKIEVALLYNDSSSIFSQIVSLIPKEEIEKITIVSPYYDEKGDTLISLQKHFNNSVLNVFLPTRFGLPPNKIKDHDHINFYSWEETERAQKKISGKNEYFRKLHSKIFHFKSAGYDYCIIGSANATINGIGGPNRAGVNDEFCVLYRSSQKGILTFLGLNGKKLAINPTNLNRDKNSREETNEPGDKTPKIFISGADLSGLQLKVFIKNPQAAGAGQFSLFNDTGKPVFTDKLIIIDGNVTIKLNNQIRGLNPSSIAITDTNNQILSNRQIINNLDKLYNTDPSKANRTIRQYLSALEVGKINEFEILDYYNELYQRQTNAINNTNNKQNHTSSEKSQDHDVEMTYDQAVENAKNRHNYEKTVNTHNSVRLWETFSQLLKARQESTENEIMDEEETASSEVGRERKEPIIRKIEVKTHDELERIFFKLEKQVKSYISTVKKVSADSDHEVDIIDLSEFLLLTHIITAICAYNSYDFKDKMNIPDYLRKLKDLYNRLMREVLSEFNKLIVKHRLKDFSDNEYLNDKLSDFRLRVIYNSMLYFYLIDRNSSERFISDDMSILSLNLFTYLSPPDDKFNQYIIDASESNNELLFSHSGVIQLKNKFISLLDTIESNENYFKIGHSGFCLVLDYFENKVKYKCVFGINLIGKGELKKHTLKTSQLTK